MGSVQSGVGGGRPAGFCQDRGHGIEISIASSDPRPPVMRQALLLLQRLLLPGSLRLGLVARDRLPGRLPLRTGSASVHPSALRSCPHHDPLASISPGQSAAI